jgi:hypothetical protein
MYRCYAGFTGPACELCAAGYLSQGFGETAECRRTMAPLPKSIDVPGDGSCPMVTPDQPFQSSFYSQWGDCVYGQSCPTRNSLAAATGAPQSPGNADRPCGTDGACYASLADHPAGGEPTSAACRCSAEYEGEGCERCAPGAVQGLQYSNSWDGNWAYEPYCRFPTYNQNLECRAPGCGVPSTVSRPGNNICERGENVSTSGGDCVASTLCPRPTDWEDSGARNGCSSVVRVLHCCWSLPLSTLRVLLLA